MARMPTARRPIIETVRAEAQRIRRRQEKAMVRLDRAYKQWDPLDPARKADFDALEADAALTEREISTLESGAKVAALLERVPEGDGDEEEKPLSPEAQRAAIARLEARGPVPPRPEEPA